MFYGPSSILHLKNRQHRQSQDVVNFGDCALESVNTDQFLSEIIQDANQQKCVM